EAPFAQSLCQFPFNPLLFCFPDMRVFLAVHLPKLPLEVFRPKWSPEPASGCAVLEKDKVVITDAGARAAGVRQGMKRGGVLTLLPEIEMYDRDPARAAAAQ